MNQMISFADIPISFANTLYTWGWRLSIGGAVLTAIGLVILFFGTRVREDYAGPRSIRPERQAKFAEALSPLANSSAWTKQIAFVAASPATQEGTRLAADIFSAFAGSGWDARTGTVGNARVRR